ncbi:hypothetical protein IFHNHDMJ_00444 [Synechococcus sp. CBW1107]|nr:hypothetical protein IFHNHDMJ_00444 [Synechococcus sp. CBW1107]
MGCDHYAACRRVLRILLFGVVVAGGLATVVILGSTTLWALLYCSVKTPLDCLISLVVVLLLWGAAAALVGFALLGARRLRG